MGWGNAKINVIKCHEEGAHGKFCRSRRWEVCIVRNYWEGFWRRWSLRWRANINLLFSNMQCPEWSKSASGDTWALPTARVGHCPRHTDYIWAVLKMQKVKMEMCPWQRGSEEERYSIRKEIHSGWCNRKWRPLSLRLCPKEIKWGRERVRVSPNILSRSLWQGFQARLPSLSAAPSRVSWDPFAHSGFSMGCPFPQKHPSPTHQSFGSGLNITSLTDQTRLGSHPTCFHSTLYLKIFIIMIFN